MTGTLEQRTEIANQGMRGLFLINGGGAVALLAFLQQSWESSPSLVPCIAYGIISLVAGLVFASAVPFIRIASSIEHQRYKETDDSDAMRKAAKFSRRHRSLEKASIAAFVIGMGIVVFGVLNNLPTSP